MHPETEMGHILVKSLIIMCLLNIHTLKGETTHSFIISSILDSVSYSPSISRYFFLNEELLLQNTVHYFRKIWLLYTICYRIKVSSLNRYDLPFNHRFWIPITGLDQESRVIFPMDQLTSSCLFLIF